MKERGVLFSKPMVLAVLDGVKTQTRRVMKVQPIGRPTVGQASLTKSMTKPVTYAIWDLPAADGSTCCICPYGVPGKQRLWVREAWRADVDFDDKPPRDIQEGAHVWYEADCGLSGLRGLSRQGKLRPGMFMPRWASRITLEVTEMRVQRLQQISEADALAEGIDDGWLVRNKVPPPRVISYRDLWEDLNGSGSWNQNPYVWCVSFKRVF